MNKETNKSNLKRYLETDNKLLKKERSTLKNRLSYVELQIKANDEKIRELE